MVGGPAGDGHLHVDLGRREVTLDGEPDPAAPDALVAEVEKIAPDRRVWVLMDILGGRTRVAVAQDLLRATGN